MACKYPQRVVQLQRPKSCSLIVGTSGHVSSQGAGVYAPDWVTMASIKTNMRVGFQGFSEASLLYLYTHMQVQFSRSHARMVLSIDTETI